LSRLFEGGSPATRTQLIGAHVEAIRVIVRDNVKQNAPQVAAMLAAELEARVTEVLPEKKKQA
jgi:hypothetical protein